MYCNALFVGKKYIYLFRQTNKKNLAMEFDFINSVNSGDGFDELIREADKFLPSAPKKEKREGRKPSETKAATRKAGRPKNEARGARHTVYVDDDAYTLLLFYKAHLRKAGKDMTLGAILSDAINEKVKRDAGELYNFTK